MQASLRRVPSNTTRILKHCSCNASISHNIFNRKLTTHTPKMSVLFPRFPPLFRLSDELDRAVRVQACVPQARRSVQPRFDVRESGEAYELLGELPGLDSEDVNIEWSDDNTLSISGNRERRRQVSSNDKPTAATEAEAEADSDFVDVASEHSSSDSYKKPTVEDDLADGVANPTEPEAPESEVAKPAPAEKPEFWYTERSYGSFRRTFKFSQRVEQDAVSATLKNGVLSIVVPKAKAREPKRITIN
jgi:HSP20 family protein